MKRPPEHKVREVNRAQLNEKLRELAAVENELLYIADKIKNGTGKQPYRFPFLAMWPVFWRELMFPPSKHIENRLKAKKALIEEICRLAPGAFLRRNE